MSHAVRLICKTVARAGLFQNGYLSFLREIPCIGPDIDFQDPIESAGGRDLVQVERGRHAFEGPGEFLAVRQEPDDLVMLHSDPLRFVVDGDGALCGRRLRGVAEHVGLGDFGDAGQAGRGKRQHGKRPDDAFHVNLHFDSWNEITFGAPELRRKLDARPGPPRVYSWYARLLPAVGCLRRACRRLYNPRPHWRVADFRFPSWLSSGRLAAEKILEAFLVSTGIVALAEIGDKTQLLALVLAARYRRPVPVSLGILAATLANHALAAWLGAGVAAALGPQLLRWILGFSFLAMAAWTLIPDKPEKEKTQTARLGAFAATLIAFFILEVGDKTQIANVALAARYASIAAVVSGTTLGMMLADVPAVYFGERILRRVPAKTVRRVAAASFALLGALALLDIG